MALPNPIPEQKTAPAWYERPLLERPKDTLETDLGRVDIELTSNIQLSFEIPEPVEVNRVLYHIVGQLDFHHHREEWVLYSYPRRVKKLPKPGYTGKTWAIIQGDPTPAARDKIRQALEGALNTWLERHWMELNKGGSGYSDNKSIAQGFYKR